MNAHEAKAATQRAILLVKDAIAFASLTCADCGKPRSEHTLGGSGHDFAFTPPMTRSTPPPTHDTDTHSQQDGPELVCRSCGHTDTDAILAGCGWHDLDLSGLAGGPICRRCATWAATFQPPQANR